MNACGQGKENKERKTKGAEPCFVSQEVFFVFFF
jgi:hypothetical protein